MIRLVRSEWTKLFTTKVWLGLLLGACVMVVGFAVLRADGREVTAEDGTLSVTGSTPADVGRRAFAAGIELHELRSRTSGLEEIYFQLTAGPEQFAAPSPGAPVTQEVSR